VVQAADAVIEDDGKKKNEKNADKLKEEEEEEGFGLVPRKKSCTEAQLKEEEFKTFMNTQDKTLEGKATVSTLRWRDYLFYPRSC
jgi:hypothetical protein